MAQTDRFYRAPSALTGPAKYSFAITPNDGTDLATPCRTVYVGTAGNIKLELAGDTAGAFVILNNVPAGTMLAVRARKIWATGTSAANLVGLN